MHTASRAKPSSLLLYAVVALAVCLVGTRAHCQQPAPSVHVEAGSLKIPGADAPVRVGAGCYMAHDTCLLVGQYIARVEAENEVLTREIEQASQAVEAADSRTGLYVGVAFGVGLALGAGLVLWLHPLPTQGN